MTHLRETQSSLFHVAYNDSCLPVKVDPVVYLLLPLKLLTEGSILGCRLRLILMVKAEVLIFEFLILKEEGEAEVGVFPVALHIEELGEAVPLLVERGDESEVIPQLLL